MGASFHYSQQDKSLIIQKGPKLQGGEFAINDCIDALPILSVLGCACKRPLKLTNASIARKKESDRLSSMTTELRKMGAIIEETNDSLTIFPSHLQGTTVHSCLDHRVAMALSIAGLFAEGTTLIQATDCIEKSYPQYTKELSSLGFSLQEGCKTD